MFDFVSFFVSFAVILFCVICILFYLGNNSNYDTTTKRNFNISGGVLLVFYVIMIGGGYIHLTKG
jgi:hypothetical protein